MGQLSGANVEIARSKVAWVSNNLFAESSRENVSSSHHQRRLEIAVPSLYLTVLRESWESVHIFSCRVCYSVRCIEFETCRCDGHPHATTPPPLHVRAHRLHRPRRRNRGCHRHRRRRMLLLPARAAAGAGRGLRRGGKEKRVDFKPSKPPKPPKKPKKPKPPEPPEPSKPRCRPPAVQLALARGIFDIVAQVVSNGANNDIAFLVDKRRCFERFGGLGNGFPDVSLTV